MAMNKFINTGAKVAKAALSVLASGAILEAGYHGARMLENDFEYVVKTADSKINPKVMKKRNWWSKPELYNTRTKKFVADMKKAAKKSK